MEVTRIGENSALMHKKKMPWNYCICHQISISLHYSIVMQLKNRVPCPILFLSGQKDHIVPPSQMQVRLRVCILMLIFKTCCDIKHLVACQKIDNCFFIFSFDAQSLYETATQTLAQTTDPRGVVEITKYPDGGHYDLPLTGRLYNACLL